MKKNEKKKMNTYKKYGLIIGIAAIAGFFVGVLGQRAESVLDSFGALIVAAVSGLRMYALQITVVAFGLQVVFGEIYLRKIKTLGKELEAAEDECADRIDYELEKAGAIGTILMMILMLVVAIVISTELSRQYLNELELMLPTLNALGSLVVFCAVYTYGGYWSVRFVKFEQKQDSTKKGDPTSIKFQLEYVESCDEAEKELIYQSAFYSYAMMSQIYGVVLGAAMLLHLFWNTGITAVILVGILQLMHTLFYVKFVVQKKRKTGRKSLC